MESFFAILLFLSLCACLLAGFPVAWTLAGVSLLFAGAGWALDIFTPALLHAMPSRIFGTMTNATLFAIPLFILMGVILERSNVARELLQALSDLFGKRPGGLAVAVTLVSTLLAASTGIVGATVVTMGLLALPVMLKNNYDPGFSAASVAASGTLGVIIPPSILLILLGDVLSSAYSEAQRASGNFATETISVGDLFAGALLPGVMISFLYITYQLVRTHFDPSLAPAPKQEALEERKERMGWGHLLRVLIAPLSLIISVLGAILIGAATPTEAAAIGTIGACLIAAERLQLASRSVYLSLALLLLMLGVKALFGTASELVFFLQAGLGVGLMFFLGKAVFALWQTKILTEAVQSTTKLTSMIFAILICASLFSLVFRGFGGDELIRASLEDLWGGKWTAFIVVMVVIFLLGFILDFIEITFIIVPIVAPVLIALGFDPLWLGIMIAINLQTSFLTPPFGFALFYLRGVAPPSVSTKAIYKAVVPFILLQVLAMCILTLFPSLATWLPSQLFTTPGL